MSGITDRSTREPLLKIGQLNHGTLYCHDITKSRRFYEEVLGLQCIQVTMHSLMIKKGNMYAYAVVEVQAVPHEMHQLNHNGFEVTTTEEVDAAYQKVMEIKDEWGIKKITKPRKLHGDYQFFFSDLDGNWWEVSTVPAGGLAADFDDATCDLTGRHDLEAALHEYRAKGKMFHPHDPVDRALLTKAKT